MILKIRIEEMKDKTGEKKRVMMATLLTDVPGMERIDAVTELEDWAPLGEEITKLTTDMLALRKKANDKKKKDAKRNIPKKDGSDKKDSDK